MTERSDGAVPAGNTLRGAERGTVLERYRLEWGRCSQSDHLGALSKYVKSDINYFICFHLYPEFSDIQLISNGQGLSVKINKWFLTALGKYDP